MQIRSKDKLIKLQLIKWSVYFEMSKQKVYLNSCEIMIDSITLYKQLEEQQVYFVWKKGKKFAKSNLYGIQYNQTTVIGEKIQLSLKIYIRNGKPQTKNTHFSVMVCQQRQEYNRQLSDFILGVHQWTSNRQKIKLEIKEAGKVLGVVNLQVKKKQVMELQNFQKYSAEIEESSEAENTIVVMDLNGSRVQGELIQLQKEIEDLKYLNEKLKKDRAYLLTRNQAVEKELVTIKANVESEVNRMKQYYERKLQMRTSIYQQQIQELITTFNDTSKTNTMIMKSIIKQNESFAADITELRIISEEELEKLNIHYKNKLSEAHQERERLQDTIQDQILRIEQLDRDLGDVNTKLDTTKSELDDLTLNYEIDKKEHKSKCEAYEKQLDTQRKLIADLKNQVSEKTEQLKISKQQQQDSQEELTQLKQLVEKLKFDQLKIENELLDKKQMIEELKAEREENVKGIKALQSQYEKYIEQSEKKGMSYQKQLQQIEYQSKQKQIEFDRLINDERQKYFEENIKLTEVTIKLQDCEKLMIVKDEESKAYAEDYNKLNEQYLQEHAKLIQYELQLRELTQENDHFKAMNEAAEQKVVMMSQQLNNCYRKNQDDLETLRDHFEASMKNREKYYEEEIFNLRSKTEHSQGTYLKLANDFRVEIQLYKDQVEKSQQQMLKQMKQNSEVMEKNRNLEIECMQFQQLLKEAKEQLEDRERKYEKLLNEQMRNAEPRMQMNQIYGDEMKESLKNLRPIQNMGHNSTHTPAQQTAQNMTLTVPKLSKIDVIPDPDQQYLKYLKQFGSVDQLKYLLSVEQTSKQKDMQIDRIQQENKELQDRNKQLMRELENDRSELQKLKQENQYMEDLIEQLKDNLRIYMEKEDEKEGEEVRSRSELTETNKGILNKRSLSFRSEQQKVQKASQEKSVQDFKQKRSLNRSRISRVLSLVNTKQQEVQVQIISQNLIENYKRQIEDYEAQKVENAKVLTGSQKQQNRQTLKSSKSKTDIAKESKLKTEMPIEYQGAPPRQIPVLQRQNSGLLKKVAEYENMNVSKDEQLKAKQIKIEKLEQRNRELFDQFALFKQQVGMKIEMQESKLLQYSNMTKKQDEEILKMKNTLLQKDQQIRETQYNLSLRLTKTDYENQQLKAENSKLKKQIEQLAEKSKRSGNFSDFHKILQQDIEDANRKIIQLNRSVNQLRMEKQSAEDEVRMYKKKNIDAERSLLDITQKKAMIEQQSEAVIRKFNKLKREFDEKQQQVLKYQESHKKMQEELTNYNALSSQNLLQRKRGLQEKLELQEEVNMKNAQIRKLTKQLQKHLQKISESDEYSRQKKSASAKEIEKLEMEFIKQKKLAMQFEQQAMSLTQKLQTVEDQNKRRTEEQKQQYREKLSSLANDIVQVKSQLEINNAERQALMEEKIALKEELEDHIQYINKLEELKDRLEKEGAEWVQQFGKVSREMAEIKRELIHYQQDSIDLHTKIVSLEEELNKQRLISLRKSEKVQQYEHLSEKYLYELKNSKVTLVQLQATVQTDNSLRSTITDLQSQLEAIKQKFDLLNQEYHQYKLNNIYSREQVEELVGQLKESYEEVRKKQLADTIDELDHEYESKNIKRQKEIIQLYNQNAKAKIEIQRREDQNSQLLQMLTQIEPYYAKYKKLKAEHDQLTEDESYLKQQVESSENKYQKYELNIKQLERVIADMKHELTRCKSDLANQKTKSSRLEQDLLEIQTVHSITKEELKKITARGNDMSDGQKTLIQNQEQKILSIELENMRVKEREENMHREYKQQIVKLQLKIKQAISTMQEENANLQRDGRIKLEEKQRQIKEMSRNMNSLSANYQQAVNEINTLKGENSQLAIELSNTRMQMSEDEEIYICEINKLKNSMKQMEEIYDYNVNALQEELAELNRQLTAEKLTHRHQNSLGSSRLRDSEVDRRIEEKMKNKDNRIEQLKNQIFILEETIGNLKKKQEVDDETTQNGTSLKYRSLYQQLSIQIQNVNKKHEVQRTNYEQTQKQLRKDLMKAKQAQQNLKLQFDQQTLQLQSLRCELNTIKEVYETLQKELQKRQIKLVENMNAQLNHDRDVEERNHQTKELSNMLNQVRVQNEQLKLKIKQKQNEVTVIADKLRQQKAIVNRLSRNDNKKVTEQKQQQNQQLKEQIERLTKENKRLSSEIDILKSELARTKNRELQLSKVEKKTSKQYSQAMQKLYECQDIVGKYSIINEKSLQNHGVSVEQLVLGGFLDEKFFDQEQELNRIRQQVEEMKFSEDRKNLDIEQMRRQNLQLNLKMEDYDYINEQVETLRKICDKLEEEKKIAVFREQAIRVRLTNLIHRNEARENIRDGLQAILNYNQNVYT